MRATRKIGLCICGEILCAPPTEKIDIKVCRLNINKHPARAITQMKFCPKCRMMYYIYIDPEGTDALVYNCQCCGHTEKITDKADLCVSRIDLKSNTQHFQNMINDSTINDPTLPHLSDRLCPNTDCATNKDRTGERDCVYICYDKPNMKYVFICTTCNTKWTS